MTKEFRQPELLSKSLLFTSLSACLQPLRLLHQNTAPVSLQELFQFLDLLLQLPPGIRIGYGLSLHHILIHHNMGMDTGLRQHRLFQRLKGFMSR